MQISLRAAFLIVTASLLFHLTVWPTVVILIGYAICGYFDQRESKKAKEAVIEDEIYGWEPDPNDPEYERKGNLVRPKLVDTEQFIVARLADILRRIP